MSNLQTSENSADKAARQANEACKHWCKELQDSLKREESYRKQGRETLEIYEGKKVRETPFNILYSNTETLSPALYNNTPRPVVDRRYKDEDPVGKEAAKIAQRMLEYFLDTGNPDELSFDQALRSVVTEALLPGRGILWFKFDAEVIDPPEPEERAEMAEGEVEPPEETPAMPVVKNAQVCWEEVPWDQVRFGYARKWKNVPWIAREHQMTREELKQNFGHELGEKIPVAKPESEDDGKAGSASSQTGVEIAQVFEIWDRRTRKVIFIAPGYPDAPLKEEDDPLSLKGFYPCPRPLTFFQKVADLTPVPLYEMYRSQAEELNITTARIKVIVKALRVRGFYDASVEGIAKVIEAEDNQMVPIDNAAILTSQGQSLDKAVWMMPIEKLVGVLQQLYAQREQAKRTLYEINGIADIMRGASQASETLGAQKLKDQWGGLRLKRLQREVQRFVRDCLRLMTEIGCEHLPPEDIKRMTGVSLPLAQEKQQAQTMLQAAQQAGQEPDPQAAEVAQAVALEEALQVLRDDLQRSYRIDIETNSTVDLEATEDKELIGEVLNAMAQFLNGIAPLIQQGFLPFDAAKGMLLSIVRRFRFGKDMEDQIKAMQQPQQPPQGEGEAPAGPTPEEQEAARAKAQTEIMVQQQKQATLQMEAELAKADHAFKMQQIQAKTVQMQRQAELAAAQHMQRMRQASLPPVPGRAGTTQKGAA